MLSSSWTCSVVRDMFWQDEGDLEPKLTQTLKRKQSKPKQIKQNKQLCRCAM